MIETLKARNALMQRIRAFFHSEGFIEVETPIRFKTPCMELHIDAEPSGDHYLRTSPELYHKKMLARGAEKIFEVAKCFRQGERGDLHNPEYTMLEWYRTGGDYMTALADTQNLLSAVGRVFAGVIAWASGDWWVFTVAEVFEKHAGWNPVEDFDADRFDFDLIEKVEPALPKDCPVVLKDYPAELCALARLKPGNPKVAERWELYLNGIEIANAYSELTDPVEQRARFEKWGEQRRALGKEVYELDEEFFQALETMPEACGVALGLDRLLMILTGAKSLDAVLPFRD
ncbi:MAG: EF-P lysine aminoacylase GenX [Kiritimatiellales bacterium]|nr:EF-P lysine aminoacylase GenX [Kiritimatiellota bacterium]MBL7011829.1 EF-P lysine aminoacylase GenX [Kiritimatiellales bacterium]